MLHYIDQICARTPSFTLSSLTCHRFLIASIAVSSKGFCDSFCTNAHYAKVGGITMAELNILEREFLSMINWRLMVSASLQTFPYRVVSYHRPCPLVLLLLFHHTTTLCSLYTYSPCALVADITCAYSVRGCPRQILFIILSRRASALLTPVTPHNQGQDMRHTQNLSLYATFVYTLHSRSARERYFKSTTSTSSGRTPAGGTDSRHPRQRTSLRTARPRPKPKLKTTTTTS